MQWRDSDKKSLLAGRAGHVTHERGRSRNRLTTSQYLDKRIDVKQGYHTIFVDVGFTLINTFGQQSDKWIDVPQRDDSVLVHIRQFKIATRAASTDGKRFTQ